MSPVAFLGSAYQELKRVIWPSRQEVVNYTVVITLSVIVAAIIIGIVDLGLVRLIAVIAHI